MKPYFEDCPSDENCRHCSAAHAAGEHFDWSFVDAVYCISLQERDDRAHSAAAEFHRVGLCRRVRFYRPERHDTEPLFGIWDSHRAVATHALSEGRSRVLILEDDVQFSRFLGPRRVRSVARALHRLPDDWWTFYLGHWPIRAKLIGRNIVTTLSACTHAYVASTALLEWLRESEPGRTYPDHRWQDFIGRGLDAAFTQLPGCYAYFPMIAVQSSSPSDHIRVDERGRFRKARHLITRTWAREFLLSTFMRPNELYTVAFSPWHALIDYVAAIRLTPK